MTPIKTYSVWINILASVAGAIVAVFQFIQQQDPETPLYVVALGVVTLAARFWKQSEPAEEQAK